MRLSLTRVATTIVVGLLVVACAPAASPAPPVTPRTSVAPASSPASPPSSPIAATEPFPTPVPSADSSGWPYTIAGDSEPVFGPDGTVYHLASDDHGNFRQTIVALDAAGHARPGWPVEAAPGSIFGALVLGPDGSAYIDECGGPGIGCIVHRLGADGRDLPGWPSEVPADFACPDSAQCGFSILDVEPSGGAYLTRGLGDELRVFAIDALGATMPGWPMSLGDHDWSGLQVGPDGALFAIRRPIGTPTFDPSRGLIDDDAQLWAFEPNGKPRAGWPVPVPSIRGYLLGSQGDVAVWSLIDDVGELCPHPRRTVYTVLTADGRTATGWPRGSTGLASFPALDKAGTLYYVSATHKVYAHDRTGEVRGGWPVPVPGAGGGCGPVTPRVAPDGTIYVAGDEFWALSGDGAALPGWPYRPASQVDAPCFDSECLGGPAANAIAPDGTLYVVVHHSDQARIRAEVVAIDRHGRLKAGWPYHVPFDASTVEVGVHAVSGDGHVFIRGGDQLLALDPDGRLSH